MKVLYVANDRLPTERAYGINIVQTCSNLARQGVEVLLLLPKRKKNITTDVFEYYGVEKNFKVCYLKIIDLVYLGKYGFLFSQIFFACRIFFNFSWKTDQYIILTRDIITSLIGWLRGYKVFHDLHGFPESSLWFWKFVLRRMNGIIATNQWKIEQCKEKFGVLSENIILARNGFDKVFSVDLGDRFVLRQQLGLPEERKIAVYTGHLYDWKGAHILVEAAKKILDVLIVLVGGNEKEVKDFSTKYDIPQNVMLLGHRPHQQIPRYLQAADVLVLPNSTHSDWKRLEVYSKFDTSPIKLFEYMASGRPMVASNLPSLKEILNEKTAVFFEADNPGDLADKISFVLKNTTVAQKMSDYARKEAQEYGWENRAKLILDFLQRVLSK